MTAATMNEAEHTTDTFCGVSLKDFVRERNEALLSGDVERVRQFYIKWNPGLRTPPTEVMEMAMHKARTAALGLPVEEREKSKKWLTDRGLSHFGDES